MIRAWGSIVGWRPRFSGDAGLATLTVVLLFAGCAQTWKPIELNLSFEPIDKINDLETTQAPKPARLCFASLSDDRSNKDTIGTIGAPVLGSDILPWLEAGFRSLELYGHQVDESAPEDAAAFNGIGLDISLTKLYCSSKISTMRTAVVCVVTFTQGAEELGRRTYRGEYIDEKSLFGSADYRFSEESIMYALNFGLASVVDQVEKDLRLFMEKG